MTPAGGVKKVKEATAEELAVAVQGLPERIRVVKEKIRADVADTKKGRQSDPFPPMPAPATMVSVPIIVYVSGNVVVSSSNPQAKIQQRNS